MHIKMEKESVNNIVIHVAYIIKFTKADETNKKICKQESVY